MGRCITCMQILAFFSYFYLGLAEGEHVHTGGSVL